MDPAERDLLQRNVKLAEDNNRMLHQMRRAQRWAMLWGFLKWALILTVSGFAYYYYLQPYVEQILQAYQALQQGGAQVQDFQQQLSNFFANWMQSTTTLPGR